MRHYDSPSSCKQYKYPRHNHLELRVQTMHNIMKSIYESHSLIFITLMRNQRKIGNKNEIIFKTILIGESGTGKSCLMNRYVKNEFNSIYQTTIGTQFQSKTIPIDQNYNVKMQIWDTAGQESFRSIIKSFFRNAGAVLLIYNITQKKTFETLSEWQALAHQSAPANALFVLVGTHLDLEQKREVQREEAEEWMNKNHIDFFFQTSARTDINVTMVFEQIGKRLFVRHIEKRRVSLLQAETQMLKLTQQPEVKTKKACC